MRTTRKGRRGVALVEALVALAVMALGMLAVVGVQGVLRGNSDVAKQRSEAVRLAQEAIETWRGFAVLEADASTAYLDYTDIGNASAETIAGLNASYSRARTVTDLLAPQRGKMLRVDVSWVDRAGAPQNVQLTSVLAGVAPELALTLVARAEGSPTQLPMGRNPGIPLSAKDLGGGKSGWLPPGAPAGTVLVFNNLSAIITLGCTTTATVTSDLTSASITGCSTSLTTGRALPLSGFVRYALTSVAPGPTVAHAQNPTDTPAILPPDLAASAPQPQPQPLVMTVAYTLPSPGGSVTCYRDSGTTLNYTSYLCAVPVVVVLNAGVETVNAPWSGRLAFVDYGPPSLISTAAGVSSSQVRTCRYFETSPTPDPADATNDGDYVGVSVPKTSQNYLVIRAGDGSTAFTCPDGTGHITKPHQPA